MSNEVKITVLKRGKDPKPLTAKAPVRTLEEHRLAFLAANNKNGFPSDELKPSQGGLSLFDIFYAIRSAQTFDKSDVELWVTKIKKALNRMHFNCTTNDARTTLCRTLGYKDQKAFIKSFKIEETTGTGFWVNPKFMAPMSNYNVHAEIVKPDKNTEAFLRQIEEGYTRPTKRVFYPTLPWQQIVPVLHLISVHGKVPQLKLRNVGRKITQSTKNIIHNTESLTILARLLGYESWTKAVNSTAGGFIRCRRTPWFYQGLYEEFQHLKTKTEDQPNDQKDSQCFD